MNKFFAKNEWGVRNIFRFKGMKLEIIWRRFYVRMHPTMNQRRWLSAILRVRKWDGLFLAVRVSSSMIMLYGIGTSSLKIRLFGCWTYRARAIILILSIRFDNDASWYLCRVTVCAHVCALYALWTLWLACTEYNRLFSRLTAGVRSVILARKVIGQ